MEQRSTLCVKNLLAACVKKHFLEAALNADLHSLRRKICISRGRLPSPLTDASLAEEDADG